MKRLPKGKAGALHETFQTIGRAALLRRLNIRAARQRSPTKEDFTRTKSVRNFSSELFIPTEELPLTS